MPPHPPPIQKRVSDKPTDTHVFRLLSLIALSHILWRNEVHYWVTLSTHHSITWDWEKTLFLSIIDNVTSITPSCVSGGIHLLGSMCLFFEWFQTGIFLILFVFSLNTCTGKTHPEATCHFWADGTAKGSRMEKVANKDVPLNV